MNYILMLKKVPLNVDYDYLSLMVVGSFAYQLIQSTP